MKIKHAIPSYPSLFCYIFPSPVSEGERGVCMAGVLASFSNWRKCLLKKRADRDSTQEIMLNCQGGEGGGGAMGEMGVEQMEWGEMQAKLES